VPKASDRTLVRVRATVSAWYQDPEGRQAGYQTLESNGRLESDLLDRLGEFLNKNQSKIITDPAVFGVSDTGRGIPELIRSQLFEPFVSHGKENGTGLRLTVVQKIVQDHGGDVAVEKTSPAGTVFRLLLPLALSLKVFLRDGKRERRGRGWPGRKGPNQNKVPTGIPRQHKAH
jgi:signal transduction histidine kinase